jgi:putative transposase
MRQGEVGHLWQNRFYSCVLGGRHKWDALRYVELNPVRAGLVQHAAEWPWSSAAAHVTGMERPELLDTAEWQLRWNTRSWRNALEDGIRDADLLERIRESTRTGRPVGEDDFIAELEARFGRPLRPQKRGPKRKTAVATEQFSFEVS